MTHDSIADAMWGDTPPCGARSRIHTAMSVIRRQFTEIGLPDLLISGRYGYLLAAPGDCLDANCADELIRAGRRQLSAGQTTAAAATLREALALYRGEPLADASGVFVDAARQALEEQRLTATEELAAACLQHGAHDDVVSELTPLVARHPFRERLRGRLMLALHRTGRQAQALHLFRSYRSQLAERDGLDPGRELSELAQTILRDEPAVSIHRHRVPAMLPPADRVFVGRCDELARLDGSLQGEDDPALTISVLEGPLGMGKTALALRWAHRRRDRFPDGQLYVDLMGGRLSTQVALSRLLFALGVPAEQVPSDVDDATCVYRTLLAQRRALVLLDDAGSLEQVRALLPGAGCHVLVTTRQSLIGLTAKEGARRIVLKGLSRADSRRLLEAILSGTDVEEQVLDEVSTVGGCAPWAIRATAATLLEGFALKGNWSPASGRSR